MFDSKMIDRELKKHLPKDNLILSRAMRYSVFAGGKRFRPGLMLLVAKMLNGKAKDILPAAAAVEMIHTFTLIHDDLPCMDNSDLRRGVLTCHKKFGEDIALLAGDALNTLAFKICPPQVVAELAEALLDVVKGQVLDLGYISSPSLSQLKRIHLLKTAALIKVSAKIAAILSGAKPKEVLALSCYGEEMGLAFQIADDILDFVSDAKTLGKPAGADSSNNKSTYPLILGLEEAKRLAGRHMRKALSELEVFGKKALQLAELAEYSVRRIK
ncbi:hypothetical protein A2276_03720 [candidate division WOR-1 bacterium RIFOXYA12_FULL_43_27]|uniref:Geranyl transferase n=1 Tax=candidate division WOR-1 bacterium RIFOXYC2_FULL_46_14 TaxID=1802587 RepID=A0A1F4U755_UNCSA|nr:MAG: hypothetical protein A2276_03720 [candidate division WOR-1 bacterium RIFOXYA12_FULL_43_27]OGC19197.1 MAG: hypothetical protein A2292_00615 [candidate division WOR-1 bacterium RIFOXYB2_FULL_46_45]OGC30186.1 MAG: hypothetical protein A2232_00615 [candidate division WOR-1 bacterium RIFOXYA2_FULL_46_56]OGC40788.1 MAG: hypothetical protein A2438_00620 [candidate division WOR-1 bacterium RIFOXYC2_FULL_46_14]